MWITRYLLPSCAVIALLLAWLAPRASAPAATVPARELLERIQREGGRNCRFDRSTSAALAAKAVPRPAEGASLDELEAQLSAAGFRLRPLGSAERRHYEVEYVADAATARGESGG